ncbi:MAG TPA: class I SAM-dependent methyltransferase [Pyrinomonadaceae bacterium]|nr:class I SAM-dependent methyltransferase [Pyrinomonadaceae bacterium]
MITRADVAPLFFAPLRLCARYFSVPRARNDYATHVPILIGLARIREIKSVLEFGCGHYSTLTFLNRSAFPHLERLHSIENDACWAETIQKLTQDQRWRLQIVDGEIAESVSLLDLEAFDLILIDDSKTSAQRKATIRAIASRWPQRAWIVIHDYEVDDYRQAAIGFKRRYTFRAYNPQTGLVSNHAIREVKRLARLLKHNQTLEPDDVEGWITAIS